jgi:mRNA interferase RelE/StbE
MVCAQMTYKIIIHPEAAKEIAALDHRVRLLVFKQIKQLSQMPGLGAQLGNKMGMNLSGFRKVYVDKKRIRIVYKIFEELILVQIIAVGKREGMQVYEKAAKRTQSEAE